MQETQTTVDEKLEIPRLDSSRGRAIAIIAGILVLAAAVTAYFLMRDTEINPYRVAQVSRTSIVKEIRVTGHLELTDEVEVPAPIEGQLVKVLVQPGDRVEEGQLLAQLDKGSAEVAFHLAQAEVQVARARVSEAEAAAHRATEALQRTERLAKKNLASKSTLETARSESAKTRAAVQAARAERSAAQKRASLRAHERERTDIVSPRAGLVLEVPPHTGMIVGPQTRLFRIGAPVDQMYVVAPVGEADIGEATVGLEAKFEVPTYPGRVFEAALKHISPNPQTESGCWPCVKRRSGSLPRVRRPLQRAPGFGASEGQSSRKSKWRRAYPTVHSPRFAPSHRMSSTSEIRSQSASPLGKSTR
jgi:RND family efflux transporter MFP subunit